MQHDIYIHRFFLAFLWVISLVYCWPILYITPSTTYHTKYRSINMNMNLINTKYHSINTNMNLIA